MKVVSIEGLNIGVGGSHTLTQDRSDPAFASIKYKVQPEGGTILATRSDSAHHVSLSSLPSTGECATKAFMEKVGARTETSRREGSSWITAR